MSRAFCHSRAARSPEPVTTTLSALLGSHFNLSAGVYGFRARDFVAPRNDSGVSQRSAPIRRGAGTPVPFFPSLPKKEMERREAPGRCATAPKRGAGALRRTPQRALQGRDCESHPEARAGGDLKACEASPPNRCASRRSTPQAKPAEGSRAALSAARPLQSLGPPHECGLRSSRDARSVSEVFEAGITFFRGLRRAG